MSLTISEERVGTHDIQVPGLGLADSMHTPEYL